MQLMCVSVVLAWLAVGQTPDRPLERFEFTQIQMGMPFHVAFYAADEASANAAAEAVYARIRQLNGIMSDYEPESELMRLCRTAGQGQAVPVGRDLLAVLSRAQALSRASDGLFDVSVGPLVRLWRTARRTKQLASDAEVAAARERVGYRNILIDETAGTVELLRTGMQLDLGGIGAGYAVDEALKVLSQRGIDRAMVDASGDIGVSGPPPGKPGWRIGIAPLEMNAAPSRYLSLDHAAVTTSGDVFQFIELDGKRYSHIIDPRTGLGLTERVSVTVVAMDCTTADSYAKAVVLLPPERGLKLIEETEAAAALVVRLRHDKVETVESKRLSQYAAATSDAARAP